MPAATGPEAAGKRRSGCLPILVGLAVVAGAFIWIPSLSGSDEHATDGEVTVTDVVKGDADETYTLAGAARAINDTGEGWLEIPARDVGWVDNRTPFLTATVHYDEQVGLVTTCETPKSWIWSTKTGPMDLTFECGSLLMLEDITSITVSAD